jgi:23S rRNA (cytosine1962-C5)-methyltransferase
MQDHAILKVIVSPKAQKSLARRHPWVFSGAVRTVDSGIAPGDTVAVHATDGQWLAWGAFSPHSQIRVRVWSFDQETRIGEAFFRSRLSAALKWRERLSLPDPCEARRLVNAESDGLPGVIVDQYNDFLVCQFLSAGAEKWSAHIVEALQSLLPVSGIFERSDSDVRAKEGLPERCGLRYGAAPPEMIQVRIGAVSLAADIVKGHKTGLYLDQRENYARITAYAKGARMLNCFSYSGGFGLWALHAGAAHVTHLDASEAMLALARHNHGINGMEGEQVDFVTGNAFEWLRRYRDAGREFDLIVLDPPKFVAGNAQLTRGCRGYKDINLLAFKLLRPGGILFTFSCSGLVERALFQKIVADAAADARRDVRIFAQLSQAADHPVGLHFPEGHYLKGLICGVD